MKNETKKNAITYCFFYQNVTYFDFIVYFCTSKHVWI